MAKWATAKNIAVPTFFAVVVYVIGRRNSHGFDVLAGERSRCS